MTELHREIRELLDKIAVTQYEKGRAIQKQARELAVNAYREGHITIDELDELINDISDSSI